MNNESRRSVSVVLPVRNGDLTLDVQLAALSCQDYSSAWEVILVDNASTDDTQVCARRWEPELPVLRVVAESRVGLNAARNRGVGEARGDLVLLCDADDEVTPGWIREMAAALGTFDL